ncbi:MAG: hypothetical protein AAB609_03575 [Patescibacteria group bacterium]
MRIRKLKRKGKFFFIKVIFPILILLILSALLLYKLPAFTIFNKPIISPLGQNKPSRASSLEVLLKKANVPFSSVTSSSDSYIITLLGGGKVIVSSKKDLTLQISSLQLMLNRLTIEGKRIKSLDFRFDKAIINF